jgi:hypothetical protein
MKTSPTRIRFQRLALVVGLCLALSVVAAASAAANPVTPDGEPLRLSSFEAEVPTVTVASAIAHRHPVTPGSVAASPPTRDVPTTEPEASGSGSRWVDKPALVGALLAALTLIALFVSTGPRRGSAGTTRAERSRS